MLYLDTIMVASIVSYLNTDNATLTFKNNHLFHFYHCYAIPSVPLHWHDRLCKVQKLMILVTKVHLNVHSLLTA